MPPAPSNLGRISSLISENLRIQRIIKENLYNVTVRVLGAPGSAKRFWDHRRLARATQEPPGTHLALPRATPEPPNTT